MKHTIVIIGVGISLLFALTVVVSGERVVTDNKTPAKVEKQDTVGQAPHAPGNVIKSTPRNEVHGQEVSTHEPKRTAAEIKPVAPVIPADAAEYDIPWQSINAGGDDMQSIDYKISSSVGQSVVGYAASANFGGGVGYWYGTGEGCDCGIWGDVTGDGNINPVDVVFMVNRVYLGNDMVVQHPDCPRDAADITCDGNVNPVDMVFFVNRVYLGNDMFCADPCGP